MKTLSSIACNLDADILLAALPLLEAEKVQAIEWSFDTLYKFREVPPWFTELLQEFGRAGRLIGHGVFFSLFSGKWSAAQQDWLNQLTQLSKTFRFDHITEHFGFMTGADFHAGAPISLPFTPVTLAIGTDRLRRIYDACQCPVGLENLAFSYSLDEVKKHGDFLFRLIEPINGFIILDLHNLYCQSHNFGLEPDALLQLYPLDRVREIHISGGSWEDSPLLPSRPIRRDTHDDSVPAAVFQMLEYALGQCPNVKFVVMEQLGAGLKTETSRRQFQADFETMDAILRQQESSTQPTNAFLPAGRIELGQPLEDELLHRQQRQLSDILEQASGCTDAQRLLSASELAHTAWGVEKWEPYMLETALRIAQKWKKGFS